MDIKKHTRNINKVSISLLIVGFIVGIVVMYLYFQPKLAYQEKLTNSTQTLANQNHNEAVSYKDQLASASAELKALQATPAPQATNVAQNNTSSSYALYNTNFSYCKPLVNIYQRLHWSTQAIEAYLQNNEPECLP